MTLAAILSIGIGVSLGLLGGGGSILALPVLVYAAGVSPNEAVAPSLLLVGTTSLAASLAYWRRGLVDARVVVGFGGAGLAGSFVGARLTHLVSPAALMLLFAGVLAGAGAWLLKRRPHPPVPRVRRSLALPAGAGVGVLTGFLGVGGGFLIVPALVATMGLDIRAAVGASLVIIAANCAAGFLGHLGQAHLHLGLTAALTTLAIAGAVVGERLARRLQPAGLRRAFASFVLVVAVVIAAREVAALALG